MALEKRIRDELIKLKDDCYDNRGNLIPQKVYEFSDVCRKYHFAGKDVYRYDMVASLLLMKLNTKYTMRLAGSQTS